jgi:YVTN family beta-propeller protein
MGVHPLKIDPVQDNIHVVNQGSNTVSVINSTTNKVVNTIPVGINPVGLTVTDDNNRLMSPTKAQIQLAHALAIVNKEYLGAMQFLKEAANERGAKIRILTPADDLIVQTARPYNMSW